MHANLEKVQFCKSHVLVWGNDVRPDGSGSFVVYGVEGLYICVEA